MRDPHHCRNGHKLAISGGRTPSGNCRACMREASWRYRLGLGRPIRGPREPLGIDFNTFVVRDEIPLDNARTATAIGDSPERREALASLGDWLPWVNLYVAIATDGGHHEPWDNYTEHEDDGLRHISPDEINRWDQFVERNSARERSERERESRAAALRLMGAAEESDDVVIVPEQWILQLVEGRRLASSGKGKRIRELVGLTQEELAIRLGVSTPAVSRWESGRSRPRREMAIRYLKVLAELVEKAGISV